MNANCEYKDLCILCLNVPSESVTVDHIHLFNDSGRNLNLSEILSEHFWFKIDESKDDLPKTICVKCWRKVESFHIFYQSVEIAHRNYFEQLSGIKYEKSYSKSINSPSNSLVENETYFPFLTDADLNASQCDDVDALHSSEQYNEINDIKCEVTPDIILEKRSNDDDEKPLKRKRLRRKHRRRNSKDYDEQSLVESLEDREEPSETTAEEDKRIAQYFNMNCDFCGFVFRSFAHARYHYREQHEINKGYLRCCNRKFEHRGYVLEHIKWHLNPNMFSCKLCDKNFASKRKLNGHMLTHAPEESKIYICDKCNKGFPRKHLLHTHTSRVHPTGELKFICSYCQKSFVLESIMRSHILHVHERVRGHICDICAKAFITKQALEGHRLTHTDTEQTRIPCNICGALLKNAFSLERHLKRHTDGPQTCKYCNKVKPNRSALASHMLNVHSKPIHQCTLCDKSFKKTLSLTEHMASHTGENLYTCPYCPQMFRSNSNMHKHRKQSHPEQWTQDRGKKLPKNR